MFIWCVNITLQSNTTPEKLNDFTTLAAPNIHKTHRPITYNHLVLTERLFPHLREVQQDAQARLDRLMLDMLVFNPPPDKATNGVSWAAHMSEIHRVAEKMILDEIVYV